MPAARNASLGTAPESRSRPVAAGAGLGQVTCQVTCQVTGQVTSEEAAARIEDLEAAMPLIRMPDVGARTLTQLEPLSLLRKMPL